MEVGSRVINFFAKKDNVVHLFLAGAFVALGFRSAAQQDEIDSLEIEKDSLRQKNKMMQKTLWEWRQSLFNRATADPSGFPIPRSRLRAIYGDEDQADPAASFAPPLSDIPEPVASASNSPPRITI